jgi:hypothetical protein
LRRSYSTSRPTLKITNRENVRTTACTAAIAAIARA